MDDKIEETDKIEKINIKKDDASIRNEIQKSIIAAGFNTATTAKGCREAVKKGFETLEYTYFESPTGDSPIIFGSNDVSCEFAISIKNAGKLDNPKFYFECETEYSWSLWES